jgi:DNA repair protein RecO (recombination protein O)
VSDDKAHGIVLRVRPLTETSLIVNWLTRDLGRISTVAKGARRPKSSFRGKVDLYYEADFSFARSRRGDLHTLREVTLLDSHAALRREWVHLEQLAYCSKLIEQTTEPETPLEEMHELFRGLLGSLEKHAPTPVAVLGFELKLLEVLGMQPDWEEKGAVAPEVREWAEKLVGADWPGVLAANLSPGELKALNRFLQAFLIYHLDKVPRGRNEALRM